MKVEGTNIVLSTAKLSAAEYATLARAAACEFIPWPYNFAPDSPPAMYIVPDEDALGFEVHVGRKVAPLSTAIMFTVLSADVLATEDSLVRALLASAVTATKWESGDVWATIGDGMRGCLGKTEDAARDSYLTVLLASGA